jgi:Trk K+ transport system NAD-binding subunit
LIAYADTLYRYASPFLGFFERQEHVHLIEQKLENELENHVVVIGAHRVGGPIVEYLQKSAIPFAVIDFNPHVVEHLRKKGVNVIYGDISDPEILDNLQIEKAKLIISTATEVTDNENLLVEVKRRKLKAKMVARALDEEQAKKLKALGAEYVILPEKVSGDYLATQLKASWPEIKFSGLS